MFFCCVLCSNTHHYNDYTSSHLCGPDNNGSAWCDSAARVDSEGHNVGLCWPCDNAVATFSVPDSFSGIGQLCQGSSTGKFLFQVEPPTNALYYMLLSVMVFAFGFQIPMKLPCSPMVAQPLGFATLQPFGVYPWQAYVPPCDGPWLMLEVHQVLLLPLFCVGGASYYSFTFTPAIPSIWWGVQLWGLAESPYATAFPTWQGGVFFSR